MKELWTHHAIFHVRFPYPKDRPAHRRERHHKEQKAKDQQHDNIHQSVNLADFASNLVAVRECGEKPGH